MHTSVLLANLVSAISFSGANQREGSIICGSGGQGKGGGAYRFFYLLSDTNTLASTRSYITIQLSDFVPEGDRGGGVGGAQVGLEVILDLPAKNS